MSSPRPPSTRSVATLHHSTTFFLMLLLLLVFAPGGYAQGYCKNPDFGGDCDVRPPESVQYKVSRSDYKNLGRRFEEVVQRRVMSNQKQIFGYEESIRHDFEIGLNSKVTDVPATCNDTELALPGLEWLTGMTYTSDETTLALSSCVKMDKYLCLRTVCQLVCEQLLKACPELGWCRDAGSKLVCDPCVKYTDEIECKRDHIGEPKCEYDPTSPTPTGEFCKRRDRKCEWHPDFQECMRKDGDLVGRCGSVCLEHKTVQECRAHQASGCYWKGDPRGYWGHCRSQEEWTDNCPDIRPSNFEY